MADNKNITICSLHKIFFFNSSTTYKIQKLKQLDNIKIKRAFIIKKRNRRIKKYRFFSIYRMNIVMKEDITSRRGGKHWTHTHIMDSMTLCVFFSRL